MARRLPEYTFDAGGQYYLEVTSWLFSSGLPIGVDYELQVSVARPCRPPASCSRPQPVLENENGNNTAPQRSTSHDFFNFFDPNVGDTCAAHRRAIDWLTPYARIQGSGDGSFDLYSFTVTSAMINPTALTNNGVALSGTGTSSVPDPNGPFFTDVSLRLNGRVTVGDWWTLGIRYHDYRYQAVEGNARDDRAAPRPDAPVALQSRLGRRHRASS